MTNPSSVQAQLGAMAALLAAVVLFAAGSVLYLWSEGLTLRDLRG